MSTHYGHGTDIVDGDISGMHQRTDDVELQERNVRESHTPDKSTDALLSEWSPRFRGSGIESPDTLVDSRSLAYRHSGIESIPDTLVESRSGTPLLVCPFPVLYKHTRMFEESNIVEHYQNSFGYNSRQSLLTTHAATPSSPTSGTPPERPTPAIARLHERDDAEIWKGWRRWVFRFIPVLAFTNTSLYLSYLALRIYCVVSAQRTQKTTYPGAWVFLSLELAVAIPSQMHNVWTMLALKKRNRPKLRLEGEEAPTVDIFITCCGEDDEVVLDTLRAACVLNYPQDQLRVIVLDDGGSESLKVSVGHIIAYHTNVYYMAREKIPGVPHHFKAGNLNYGLDQVHSLPGGAGEYMAALDADMIPEPDWLRAIIPHLILDPKMALACPPQLFYNTPASDPLAQSLNFFVHVIEPIKDALGVAWCTGSGYVARREALDDIGNFPLGSLAEDVATSTLMLGKGWHTGYIHEPLQYGTVPEDFGGHLKQRTRWVIGTIQTAFKLNFCLWGTNVKQMTVAQRFSGFLYATLSFLTILVSVALFAIPVVLLWGKPLIAYSTLTELKWLIRACFAATISSRLCEFVLFIPAGYNVGQRDYRYQIWMSPYLAMCIIRAFFLPKWLGGQVVGFKPTGSLGSALNERDPKLRKNVFRRLWAILFNYLAIFHFGFVYLTLVAVLLTSYKCFYQYSTTKEILLCLIIHAFWPPLTFLFVCSSLWTPISYAINPPSMPDREALLERDSKTGVAHPTANSKKIAYGGQAAWFEMLYSIATVHTVLVFVYSFFM
ncbi:probable glycosyl transferase [Rhynchosporium graminicola]|uniref:Probable glycosyl transferase n=1 Tax=Rhynchosporium graminicola TaxID=2792576 RepID=A0A1E1LH08_9HELO|nr:probable glycosyl transferase [Rhynchosporium commune]